MDIGGPTYVCIIADTIVKASISCSRIDSRANIHYHQEGNSVELSILRSGIDSRPYILKYQEGNTIKASIFRSGIRSTGNIHEY